MYDGILLNSVWQVLNLTTDELSYHMVIHDSYVLMIFLQGLARTQIPTNKNYALEFPTFEEIAGVNQTVVQWRGLALEEPPC